VNSRKRVRRVFSVKEELLKKSREAALAAVQIFNNPNVTFAYVHELVQRERGLLTEPTNSPNNVERTSGGTA
jgi:hypothetical protein